ncbi:uncharacterized protein QC763_200740 [Podospora pseudopauciseta]|uniref:Uncharacterized protein n=1 Tax=Podospora pseudopauciseta TaxID=2093780 RepID=A0ABR0HM53_9PEZI|nr:hypothetical protein QC763_200740 [Podospora pseudopauciseta]
MPSTSCRAGGSLRAWAGRAHSLPVARGCWVWTTLAARVTAVRRPPIAFRADQEATSLNPRLTVSTATIRDKPPTFVFASTSFWKFFLHQTSPSTTANRHLASLITLSSPSQQLIHLLVPNHKNNPHKPSRCLPGIPIQSRLERMSAAAPADPVRLLSAVNQPSTLLAVAVPPSRPRRSSELATLPPSPV